MSSSSGRGHFPLWRVIIQEAQKINKLLGVIAVVSLRDTPMLKTTLFSLLQFFSARHRRFFSYTALRFVGIVVRAGRQQCFISQFCVHKWLIFSSGGDAATSKHLLADKRLMR
jgi:hypothetical protein